MNVHWWIAGTLLLALLAASAWPPWRTILTRYQQPRLLGSVSEIAPDDVTPYTLTSVTAGWCDSTLVTATWDQVAEHAATRSTEIDTAYVCVLQGVRMWCWQRGLMTDAIADAPEDDHSPPSTP
ncbi:hypothetical protein AB0O34_29975 [Sphaerisporangium sp. NPDC088356]|uniref:hypothetical protein n=1 Tax=Sphaerisporangium sp. NPDC088356 TaxID=3154871 RepID=UPI003429C4FC